MIDFRRIAIFDPFISLSPPIQDAASSPDAAAIFRWTSYAIRKGADAVYLRVHGLTQTTAEEIYQFLQRHPRMRGIPILVPTNLAPTREIDGVHLREGQAKTEAMAASKTFGRSCHDLIGVQNAFAEGLDYVFLSPVFSTKTHPDAPALGLENLQFICDSVPEMAVFALGGVTTDRAESCRRAGAYGYAAIRDFTDLPIS